MTHTAENDARFIRVPRPQIHTGPKGMTVDEATVMYLRDAASRVREQRYWGSGVTALVSDLLDDAAERVEATTRVIPPGEDGTR
jgi:hypothetical protein